MLRVGLTGGLGSGKSTAAALFSAHGAHVLSADDLARDLMQPGQSVYDQIVETFGPAVRLPDGRLDRPGLARAAFGEGRIDELNAIVHPATIARQAELTNEIAARDLHAIIIVESALILETKYGETKYGETKYGETKYGETKYGETNTGKQNTRASPHGAIASISWSSSPLLKSSASHASSRGRHQAAPSTKQNGQSSKPTPAAASRSKFLTTGKPACATTSLPITDPSPNSNGKSTTYGPCLWPRPLRA